MRKNRILIVGQSPALPTGMAEVIRLIFEALLDRYPESYEIHQLALTHSFAVVQPRWTIYCTRGTRADDGRMIAFECSDLAGEQTFPGLVREVQPDIVFAFNDPQRVLHLCKPATERRYKLIVYTNIDGLPFGPGQGPILKNADRIVTMSAFSREVLLRSMPVLDPARVSFLYSPADISRFKPSSIRDRMAIRKKMFPSGWRENSFVLGWVGRTQWRKQSWLPYEVISHLRRGGYRLCVACGNVTGARSRRAAYTYPKTCPACGSEDIIAAQGCDDIVLWIHSPGEEQQDWNPRDLDSRFDLKDGFDLCYTRGHMVGNWKTPGEMGELYRAWDCLLYLSGGEGFGMPAWEAMCSELPAVFTNYSSHAELMNGAKAGIAVGGVLQPEPRTCIMRMIGSLDETIAATLMLYRNRALCAEFGANGRAFASRFSPERQAEAWHNLFNSVLT